ncbi:hypothetical protein [Tengunoibacter tsumagoiensis]|uniref:Uncharacterized protein n=1 Tax=Tengunoibacter tsumagoiensis TaxID=2014871 RepID=A0A401ZV87_9CHLR|nr:hypothetical protein [Tengunoibacter tsumagoiensis]GCE10811.1 hypothetical protein KTT_06700 [Tengunoibacter tsumagoiensis]
MGNPIEDAYSVLEDIFNDAQTRRKIAEEDFVAPLKLLPKTQIEDLDAIHDDCVQSIQTSIGKLFGPGSQFQGEASSAVADLIGSYFTQEAKLNDYTTKNNVSKYMTQLEQITSASIHDAETHIDAIKGCNTSNVFVNRIVSFWSDLFTKGPGSIPDNMQVGPWSLGQIFRGDFSISSNTSHSQMYAPPSQVQTPTPQSGFWEAVAAFLAPFAAVILVVNIVTDVIQQLSLDWHIESLGWTVIQWAQHMNDLHSNILLQNSESQLPGDIGKIKRSLNADQTHLTMLKIGVPDPNLPPNKQKLADKYYQKYKDVPNGPTLLEIQYIIDNFPPNQVDSKIYDLAWLKLNLRDLKLPPGYLLFFVMQGIPKEQIEEDIFWLQKASQNTGNGPGNIIYRKGRPLSNPSVDFLTAETYGFEAQAADQIRGWMNQILNDNTFNYRTIPNFYQLPGAVQSFLELTSLKKNSINKYNPNDPLTSKFLPKGYQGQFGTAVQELVKVSVRSSNWYGKYYVEKENLFLDTGAGLRPDIRFKQKDGSYTSFDYTTYDQRNSKAKYDNDYNPNIVLIHNGPFQGGEIAAQNP